MVGRGPPYERRSTFDRGLLRTLTRVIAPLDDLMDPMRSRRGGVDSQNRQGRHVRSTRFSANATPGQCERWHLRRARSPADGLICVHLRDLRSLVGWAVGNSELRIRPWASAHHFTPTPVPRTQQSTASSRTRVPIGECSVANSQPRVPMTQQFIDSFEFVIPNRAGQKKAPRVRRQKI